MENIDVRQQVIIEGLLEELTEMRGAVDSAIEKVNSLKKANQPEAICATVAVNMLTTMTHHESVGRYLKKLVCLDLAEQETQK